MLKDSVIYISLLDYLIEVKNKLWIMIITFILFLSLTYAHALYKKNYYDFSVKANLIKLKSLSLKGYDLQTDSKTAISFLANSAELNFNKLYEDSGLNLKCGASDHFLNCQLSGIVDGNSDDIKKDMYDSVNDSFDNYQVYFTLIIDGLISSHERLHKYVSESNESDLELRAQYKSYIEEASVTKQMFLAAVNEGRPKVDSVRVKKYTANYNYPFIILSSLLCSLFLIFIQMRKTR